MKDISGIFSLDVVYFSLQMRDVSEVMNEVKTMNEGTTGDEEAFQQLI